MGTNYYLHENVCEHCGRSESSMHVGKSSGGWRFMFHGLSPDRGAGPPYVVTRKEWLAIMRVPGNALRDEYGKSMTPEAFEDMTTNKQAGIDAKSYDDMDHWEREHSWKLWHDPEGFTFDPGEFS